MSIKTFIKYSFVIALVSLIYSCAKTNNIVPVINSPILVLTPSSDSGYANSQVSIDYSVTAANGIKRIQIFTQYLTNTKITAKDSTLPTTKPVMDQNFIYTIPDTAVRGQQSIITFTITDGNGNATTKTATITVTGSRPSIVVTPGSTTAHAKDSLSFNVVMKSPDKFIQTLNVAQVINSSSSTNLPSVPFPGTQKSVTTIYKYGVPATSNVGDIIVLEFTVANTSGVTNITSAKITVN